VAYLHFIPHYANCSLNLLCYSCSCLERQGFTP
jgi:hypothetical protein